MLVAALQAKPAQPRGDAAAPVLLPALALAWGAPGTLQGTGGEGPKKDKVLGLPSAA